MEKYVLDTNLFFNMEPGLGLGSNTNEVLENVNSAIKMMKKNKGGEFLMPPSIVKEVKSFFE